MTLQATIEAKALQTAFESVFALVKETRLKYDSYGVLMQSVDPANVCMVSLELDKQTSFTSYTADGKGELGLDLEKIIKYMKNLSDEVNLTAEESVLKLSDSVHQYSVKLTDPSYIEALKDIPSLAFTNKIAVSGKTFNRIVKSVSTISDYCTFQTRDDSFIVLAEGDTDSIQITLTLEDELEDDDGLIPIYTKTDTNVKSMFSVDYLKTMSKVLSKFDIIQMEIAENYPVRISAEIGGADSKLTYILAPRVEPKE